jgi:hypothetical protein
MTPAFIDVTFFPDFAAAKKRQEPITPERLAERIRTTTATAKEALPWLKLARFGNATTEKGSQGAKSQLFQITAGRPAVYPRRSGRRPLRRYRP